MYVLFVRHFPDFDHIVPIAHKLAERHPGQVRVIKQSSNLNLKNDYRAIFLSERHNIKVDGLFNCTRRFNMRGTVAHYISKVARYLPFPFAQRVFNVIKDKLAERKWAEALLDDLQPVAIGLDYMPLNALKQFNEIANVARSRNIPVVFLPHSAEVFMDFNLEVIRKQHIEHRIINRSELAEHYSNPDIPSLVLTSLGSSRYNREWMDVNDALVARTYPAEDLPDNPGTLKVLICTRPAIGFVGNDPLMSKLLAEPNLDLVIKGKPRNTGGMEGVESVGNKYPTTRLIQWADVIVIAGSSIAVDVLLYDKPLLHLKYLSPDHVFAYETFNACWSVDTQEELFSALERLKADKHDVPYAKEDVTKFIDHVVYDSGRVPDPLDEYAKYFERLGGLSGDLPRKDT